MRLTLDHLLGINNNLLLDSDPVFLILSIKNTDVDPLLVFASSALLLPKKMGNILSPLEPPNVTTFGAKIVNVQRRFYVNDGATFD